jgi:glycosyltransferase involved in cell wall biosynthesis
MTQVIDKSAGVSAIVPARNEEAVIAACIESLAPQSEILEVIVVDDQSTDRTAAIVQQAMCEHSKVRLLHTQTLPAGWVGKNNAVWQGAKESHGEWLLFTDADAVHASDSAARALAIAQQENAALVSFSPEQVMKTWYEKSLIPYIYCRLASHFSYDNVNNPNNPTAAANGQFLMIRKDVYENVGGHAAVASEVLEDVALARRVKSSGQRIWFGGGHGIVRVRMYRSFSAMWEGWKKNLCPLMGGTPEAIGREFLRAITPVLATYIAAISTWAFSKNWLTAIGVFLAGTIATAVAYDEELRRNRFSHRLVWYGFLGRLLFARLIWASYRSHRRGKLKWKGREYPAGTSRASNR